MRCRRDLAKSEFEREVAGYKSLGGVVKKHKLINCKRAQRVCVNRGGENSVVSVGLRNGCWLGGGERGGAAECTAGRKTALQPAHRSAQLFKLQLFKVEFGYCFANGNAYWLLTPAAPFYRYQSHGRSYTCLYRYFDLRSNTTIKQS